MLLCVCVCVVIWLIIIKNTRRELKFVIYRRRSKKKDSKGHSESFLCWEELPYNIEKLCMDGYVAKKDLPYE